MDRFRDGFERRRCDINVVIEVSEHVSFLAVELKWLAISDKRVNHGFFGCRVTNGLDSQREKPTFCWKSAAMAM
jgi:hypothetical protein